MLIEINNGGADVKVLLAPTILNLPYGYDIFRLLRVLSYWVVVYICLLPALFSPALSFRRKIFEAVVSGFGWEVVCKLKHVDKTLKRMSRKWSWVLAPLLQLSQLILNVYIQMISSWGLILWVSDFLNSSNRCSWSIVARHAHKLIRIAVWYILVYTLHLFIYNIKGTSGYQNKRMFYVRLSVDNSKDGSKN